MNLLSVKEKLRQSYLELESFFLNFRVNKKSSITVSEAIQTLNSVYYFSNKIKQTSIINDDSFVENNVSIIDLSIVTCAYNTDEGLLRACLESLINQETKYNYEIILVDDGSQNNTLDIMKEYAGCCEKITVLTQTNGGPGKARNKGILYTKGSYITFIDSDDYVDKSFVEKVLDKAYEKEYDIVKFGYKKITNGVITEHLSNPASFIHDASFALKYDGFMCGAIYRKEIFQTIKLPEHIAFEDMVVRLSLYRKAKSFCYIDEPLYYYNYYSTNTTNGASKVSFNRLDQICLLEVILRDNKTIGIPNDDIEDSLILYELGFMLWYRIVHLPLNIKECAFVYAAENIVDEYLRDIDYSNLNRRERQIYNCFIDRDFKKWLTIGRMH